MTAKDIREEPIKSTSEWMLREIAAQLAELNEIQRESLELTKRLLVRKTPFQESFEVDPEEFAKQVEDFAKNGTA